MRLAETIDDPRSGFGCIDVRAKVIGNEPFARTRFLRARSAKGSDLRPATTAQAAHFPTIQPALPPAYKWLYRRGFPETWGAAVCCALEIRSLVWSRRRCSASPGGAEPRPQAEP